MNIYAHMVTLSMSLLLSSCAVAGGTRMVAMHDLVANQMLDMPASELFANPKEAQLAEATGRGDLKQAEQLIAEGASVNAIGTRAMTPLLWAMGKRSIDGFRFLLDHGADANAVTCCDDKAPGMVHKLSAMGLAARIQDPAYLQALLAHNGKPNLVINEFGETPLFSTLNSHRYKNAEILLKAGADVNLTDSMSHLTALGEAISGSNFEMALLFLKSGADPTIKDRWGSSAVDHIMKFGNRGLLVLSGAGNVAAYKQLVSELKNRGYLNADPPDFSVKREGNE